MFAALESHAQTYDLLISINSIMVIIYMLIQETFFLKYTYNGCVSGARGYGG